jgi:hypothetical protein
MTTVPAMASMHEEMHADTEGQQCDQDSTPGEDVNTVLIGQHQPGNGEENNQDEAGARPPEAAGRLWAVL